MPIYRLIHSNITELFRLSGNNSDAPSIKVYETE